MAKQVSNVQQNRAGQVFLFTVVASQANRLLAVDWLEVTFQLSQTEKLTHVQLEAVFRRNIDARNPVCTQPVGF